MRYRSLFLLPFTCLLTGIAVAIVSTSISLSPLRPTQSIRYEAQDIPGFRLHQWRSPRSRDEEQNRMAIQKRTPGKSRPSRASTNQALTRSQSQPSLGISEGGVKAKDSRPSRRRRASVSPDRVSQGSRATESTLRAATIRTGSTGRTIRYDSHPGPGSRQRTTAASSSSGSLIQTSSTGSSSYSSLDSPPGIGNVFAQGSVGASRGSPQGSLSGFEDVLTPARSARLQYNTPRESIAGSSGRSNVAISPGSSRSSPPSRVSLSSSAGLPSLHEAISMQPSSSSFPMLSSPQRRPALDQYRMHDSPSSMHGIAPQVQNSRPSGPFGSTSRPGRNQVSPESPTSLAGSLTGEAGSSQDGHSDRGFDLESLDSHLGRLGFGH